MRSKGSGSRLVLSVALGCCFVVAKQACALEERFEDLPVSVEVAGVFSLDINQPALAFTDVSPGKSTLLTQGRFAQELKCRSNSGSPWYLKAQVISLHHSMTQRPLPASGLKWKIVESTGQGAINGQGSDFQPFSEVPTLIYASSGGDNHGQEVVLRLQYSLSPPADAQAGSYVGQVSFTMADSP